jgi:hypothetical protein
MADIDFYLLIPILFRIIPKVRERRFKQSRADTVKVRDVVPLLFTRSKYPIKVGPFSDIGLHVKNIGFGGGEGVEGWCCADIGD